MIRNGKKKLINFVIELKWFLIRFLLKQKIEFLIHFGNNCIKFIFRQIVDKNLTIKSNWAIINLLSIIMTLIIWIKIGYWDMCLTSNRFYSKKI